MPRISPGIFSEYEPTNEEADYSVPRRVVIIPFLQGGEELFCLPFSTLIISQILFCTPMIHVSVASRSCEYEYEYDLPHPGCPLVSLEVTRPENFLGC